MNTVLTLWLCAFVGFVCTTSTHPLWKRFVGHFREHHRRGWNPYGHHDYDTYQHDYKPYHHDRRHHDESVGNPPCERTGRCGGRRELGCACLLFVEQTEVFRRVDTSGRYSCDQRGLQSCSSYCSNLFRDEGLASRSRQDACDVLGRQINNTWYRKDQVCGSNGQYRDTRQAENLCCRGGRAVASCT